MSDPLDVVETVVDEAGEALADVAATAGSAVMSLAEGAAELVLEEGASSKKRRGLAVFLLLVAAVAIVYWLKNREDEDGTD